MKILRIGRVFGGFISLVLSLSAQTFTTLRSFDGTDGSNLEAALLQATSGNFYGTAGEGGGVGSGTLFKITPSGKLTTLHSFDGTDGEYPTAGLVQATNGDLHGTTAFGGLTAMARSSKSPQTAR